MGFSDPDISFKINEIDMSITRLNYYNNMILTEKDRTGFGDASRTQTSDTEVSI